MNKSILLISGMILIFTFSIFKVVVSEGKKAIENYNRHISEVFESGIDKAGK